MERTECTVVTDDGLTLEVSKGRMTEYGRYGHKYHPNRKGRIYVWISSETVLDNLMNRRNRPTKFYRTLLPPALEAIGEPTDIKVSWNQKAGCSCGCSPAFVVRGSELYGYDVHINVAA